jgi:hypothetical protein
MTDLHFGCRLEHLPDVTADAVLGDTIFEVLAGLRDARRLRAAFVDMARAADAHWVKHVVLVLDRPRITGARLREEWMRSRSVFKPELFGRLSIVIRNDDGWDGVPDPPDARQQAVAERILSHDGPWVATPARGRVEADHDVLRILVRQWLLAKGPATTSWLMSTSGYSYPTVAKALDKLGLYLKRDRRGVELTRFPREEWNRLLAVSDAARHTARFADRSGQPRSSASLLRRLNQVRSANLAVGGVWGAAHYYPDLNLVGSPRLDLSLHSGRSNPDYGFIQQLDPGLERTMAKGEPGSLVVHLVRRRESLFEPSGDGPPWADPVECLLDLHDARLDAQAGDFLRFLTASRSGA